MANYNFVHFNEESIEQFWDDIFNNKRAEICTEGSLREASEGDEEGRDEGEFHRKV